MISSGRLGRQHARGPCCGPLRRAAPSMRAAGRGQASGRAGAGPSPVPSKTRKQPPPARFASYMERPAGCAAGSRPGSVFLTGAKKRWPPARMGRTAGRHSVNAAESEVGERAHELIGVDRAPAAGEIVASYRRVAGNAAEGVVTGGDINDASGKAGVLAQRAEGVKIRVDPAQPMAGQLVRKRDHSGEDRRRLGRAADEFPALPAPSKDQ